MRYLSTQAIENKAREVLRETRTSQLPVPVDLVARRLGLVVEPVPLGDEISGLLVVRDGKGTIGVNRSHSLVRQRFTIAHECGHYVLHRDGSELFIDKGYTAVYRDARSSKGGERGEIQANQFAAALLIPRELVLEEIRNNNFDLGNEAVLEDLAKEFQVSLSAMSFRLSNLGIFPSLE